MNVFKFTNILRKGIKKANFFGHVRKPRTLKDIDFKGFLFKICRTQGWRYYKGCLLCVRFHEQLKTWGPGAPPVLCRTMDIMDPVVFTTTCPSCSLYVVCLRPSKRIDKFLFNIYRCNAKQLSTP